MENNLLLYHGSTKIIDSPEFGKGNPHNDYGPGFYCTENPELAKEWACISRNGGFANAYAMEIFVGSEPVDGEVYFTKRSERDKNAREQYLKRDRNINRRADDIFMINILNEEIRRHDSRLQENILI